MTDLSACFNHREAQYGPQVHSRACMLHNILYPSGKLYLDMGWEQVFNQPYLSEKEIYFIHTRDTQLIQGKSQECSIEVLDFP